MPLRHPRSLYFGKIPSRGDFVKSMSGTKVITRIDAWIAQGMEMLIADSCWKTAYDNAGIIDFLFMGTHKKHAIYGALIPSRDASLRRFPFVAATVFQVDEPLSYCPLIPLILDRHMKQQRSLIHQAANAQDASDTLIALSNLPFDTLPEWTKCTAHYRHFLFNTTLANLREALSINREESSMRQMVLAIGYLLQPIFTHHTVPPQKGLALPLPCNAAYHDFTKVLWLDLICTFLPYVAFELSVFSCTYHGNPTLCVTFNGTPPSLFRLLFDEQAAQEYLIDIRRSSWVEDSVTQNAMTGMLSSYLEHEDLSLAQLTQTFRQQFSR